MKMKNKLAVIIPATLLASSLSFSALAVEPGFPMPPVTPQPAMTVAGGQVNFNGSIVNTPCAVDVDSANQTVTLGQYRQAAFTQAGDVSAPVNFSIKLTDCDASVYTKAKITFSGTTSAGSENVLALNGDSASDTVASGVGVQILQNSAPLNVNGTTSSNAQTLLDGENNIPFQAQYIAIADEVGVGVANASTDFTITYE